MANGGSGSGSGSNPGDVFDVRKVRRLVELMKEHDLAEVDLKQGDHRIRLRRGPQLPAEWPVVVAGSPPQLPPAASVPPAPSHQPPAPSPPPEDEAGITYVTSPMVGTFYASSNPESPAFISVGDQVGPETTVCILEAMKVFNEIPAECSGSIVACLVESGDAIEFGQKLFKVKKS